MVFLYWITFTGFIQILAKYFGVKNSFEETLHVLGMLLYVSVYIMAFVDLLLTTHILPESLFKTNSILGNLYTIIPTILSIITTIIASEET